MKKPQKIVAGIDVGASRTKVAIINEDTSIIGRAVAKSGTNFPAAADACLNRAVTEADISRSDISRILATGYGRKRISDSDGIKTEISCHSKGCFHHFPKALTVIDIGGQDNKVIKLDSTGMRTGFRMNRKCAAGTGAFLEEMSLRLDIPLENMNGLAEKSTDVVELGSYCTVFSATEVLERISQGKKVEDIVKGIFLSVIKRVIEMDSFTENVAMSGGVVAYNPYLAAMMEEMIGKKVLVPPYPQFAGAFGAALFALGNV